MMRFTLLVLPATVLLFLAGCSGTTNSGSGTPTAERPPIDQPKATPEEQAKIATALAKLPPEDRTLAEAQQYCAVEPENRLGLMGTPIKVIVNDQPVFLCCKGCKSTALAQPDKTLAEAEKLKKAAETPDH